MNSACSTASPVRLFAYKMTHDTGFAPNPFHGFCTLATCKPKVRLCKAVGDWIAGFSSGELNGDPVGQERLVYLMCVGQKMPFEKYFLDARFVAKIPTHHSDRCIDTVGDNIYGLRDGAVFQVPNRSHSVGDIPRDTSGRFVLIAETFSYWGTKPLAIPAELRPAIPSGVSAHGARTKDASRALAFVEYAMSHRPVQPVRPTGWRRGDETWREGFGCA